MERDERYRDPLEADRCYQEAVERSLAYVQRELLVPELSAAQWPDRSKGLPDPSDERGWTRAGENSYFDRQNARAIRELAEIAVLRDQAPDLCRCADKSNPDPFMRYYQVLQVEEGFARLQNRPPCVPIIRFIEPLDCRGFYNYRHNQMGINMCMFLVDPRELLRTYLHEARHAFQFHVIRTPEMHPDIQPSTISQWMCASKTYVRPGFDSTPSEVAAYEQDLLEVDARADADRKVRQIDGR